MTRPTRLANVAIAAVAVLLALAATELVVRRLVPPIEGYYVIAPGTSWRVVSTGADGRPHTTQFHVNRDGLRGRPVPGDSTEYRLLAIGGSTTECGGLDDSVVWTHLVETGLTLHRGSAVWVGNAGKDGSTTRDHVLHLRYLLRQYPHMNAVIALVGVNDMLSALRRGSSDAAPAPSTEAELHHAFAVVPARAAHWYQRTGLWRLARRLWHSHQSYDVRERATSGLAQARARRAKLGATVDSLPRLTSAIAEFTRNLNEMINLADVAGARLVLVTQPTVWRDRMSASEQARLWFGWIGADWRDTRAYYTTGALARAMALYNQALLDVCKRRALSCIDAAPIIPRDSAVFVDDMHLTERGSRLLAGALVTTFPFRF
ncbi:MAG TPA: hypothetical protein VLT79_00600 [Gemmatimonadales bacterium]|nr:hypothetical protein [Gemmatimonadales bacterium]